MQQSRRLAKTHLIILAVISLALSACKEDMPANHPHLISFSKCVDLSKCVPGQPCLVDLSSCLVYRYTLSDPATIDYQFDQTVPLSSIDGGFCFPKGELEAVLAWGRDEQKACSPAQVTRSFSAHAHHE